MKERLSKFIKDQQLTPGKLAEIVGVQPSSISHLLAGRNKPGFEFISSLLRRFPELNPYWLILGTEPMYNSERAANHEENNILEPYKSIVPAQITSVSEEIKPAVKSVSNVIVESPNGLTEPQTVKHDVVAALASGLSAIKSAAEIERVIIFMSDGSFSSYTPSK